jgi:hypothetical protein
MDCGFKLRAQVERRDRNDGSLYSRNYYTCGSYAKSGKTACTIHCVPETALIDLVSEHIRKHALMVERNEERIIEMILTMQKSETVSYRAAYLGEIESHRKQINKLDLIIENLYNDRVTGVVTEDMFKRYVAKYEQERVDRLQSVETLESRVRTIKENADNAQTWTRLIKRYTELESLDAETLLLLIDKIIIGESELIGKDRIREIKVIYNYVGDIDRLRLSGEAVTAYERKAV